MEKSICNVLRTVGAPVPMQQLREQLGVEIGDNDFEAALRNLLAHQTIRLKVDTRTGVPCWEMKGGNQRSETAS